ncbi:MAG: universal stress protein [Anaerolineales bacterium]|nr:universal stress protein [Anaerolineales bacterium]
MFQCQRLLVPLDGSPLAERALPSAFAIAQALSHQIPVTAYLLRVVPSLYLSVDPLLFAETLSLSEEEAEAYLATIATEHATVNVPIRTAVSTGAVAESIMTYAQQENIQLIVMSSHGRSGLSRWMYGSVAEKLLRQACCASLIIRPGEKPPTTFGKILVCLDGSPLAEQVLDPILTIAKAVGAEVSLLRVVPPSHVVIETHAMEQLLDTVESLERDMAETYLNQLLVKLADREMPIAAQVVLGPVAETIIDTAVTQQVDLIAMSSHGRSGIGRWVYGSVAEKVLRTAPCATFVIRGTSPAGAPGR